MKLKIIPQEIIDQYQLQDLEENGWVYMKIVKGVPGLKQAACLANERLMHHLAPYGYTPVQYTPSLCKHESNGILFAFVVDYSGIKSTSDSATSHLFQALRDKYQITVNPSGTKFLGFVLDWDYSTRKFYLLMPNYVKHALHRLQHSLPTRLKHAPHRHNKPVYGQRIRFAESQDNSREFFLSASAKTRIQQIIGIFLYYGIVLDLTMLVALGPLATQQST